MKKVMSSSEDDTNKDTIMRIARRHAKNKVLEMNAIDIGDKATEKERLKERKRARRMKEKLALEEVN